MTLRRRSHCDWFPLHLYSFILFLIDTATSWRNRHRCSIDKKISTMYVQGLNAFMCFTMCFLLSGGLASAVPRSGNVVHRNEILPVARISCPRTSPYICTICSSSCRTVCARDNICENTNPSQVCFCTLNGALSNRKADSNTATALGRTDFSNRRVDPNPVTPLGLTQLQNVNRRHCPRGYNGYFCQRCDNGTCNSFCTTADVCHASDNHPCICERVIGGHVLRTARL